MSRLSLVALVGALWSSPVEALLNNEELTVDYAHGICNYQGYALEIKCDMEKSEGKRCGIEKVYLGSTEVAYPSHLPFPDVAFQPPKILYCKDPPQKKEEKKPFLCC